MTTIDLSLFTGLRTVGQWMLQGSTNVTKLILPYSVTEVGANIVYTQRHNIAIYVGDSVNGSNLSKMNGAAFGQARAVILFARTPPSNVNNITGVQMYYVPDDCVDIYKADNNWKNCNIRAISQFTG